MSNASDFFIGGGGGGNAYWPPMKLTTPEIVVGGSFITIANGGHAKPSRVITSYDLVTRVADWTISRTDITGIGLIMAIAFDSIASIAYVSYTAETNNDILSIAAVDLTNGNITYPSGFHGGMAVSGIAGFADMRIGRVDNANGRIHWLGISGNGNNYDIVQNIDGTEFSNTILLDSGQVVDDNYYQPIYLTKDFRYAVLLTRVYNNDLAQYKFCLLDRNSGLFSSSFSIPLSIGWPKGTISFVVFGDMVVESYSIDPPVPYGASTWDDTDMSEAIYSWVEELRFVS
jgi:hypothetical protein